MNHNFINIQGGSSTSPTKLSNGSKEGSSGKTKEAKREGKEKLKVIMMVMLMLEKMVMLVWEKMVSMKVKISMMIMVVFAGVKTTSRDKTSAPSASHPLPLPTGATLPPSPSSC